VRKLVEAGADAQRLLAWLAEQPGDLAQGKQARLLARVFGEQFEVPVDGAPSPQSQEPMADVPETPPGLPPKAAPDPSAAQATNLPTPTPTPTPTPAPTSASEVQGTGPVVKPKDKGQLVSDRVQNPHEPEAT
jgi:hypothetical protein